MKTLLLLVTHQPMGQAFKALAEHVFGEVEDLYVFDIVADEDPDQKLTQIIDVVNTQVGPKQVFVLTDLGGATPSNIGAKLVQYCQQSSIPAHIMAGTNACMLLNAVRYKDLSIDEMAKCVLEGGRKGMRCVDLAAS